VEGGVPCPQGKPIALYARHAQSITFEEMIETAIASDIGFSALP
jgi:hypothetical protein